MTGKRIVLATAGALAGGGAFLALSSFFGHAAKLRRGVGSAPAFANGAGGTFKVHATGYWPSTARDDERAMEGKNHDRIGAPLHTIEDFVAGRSDHVSLSGDLDIFPYGQLLLIEGWPGIPNLRGRVTDTGGHFFNVGGLVKRGKASKIIRVFGEEPLDFDVQSSKTFVPKRGVSATIVPGDHWASRTRVSVRDVKVDKIQGDAACAYCIDGYHHLCDRRDEAGPCTCRCAAPRARAEGLVGIDAMVGRAA